MNGGSPEHLPINLDEYEAAARAVLTDMAFDYYAGGAEDEITLSENTQAWRRERLVRRVLVDVSCIDLSTTVLGTPISLPVMAAPCSFNKLAHPDGEIGVARAVARSGSLHIVSTVATTSLEEIAEAAPNGPRWFQLYCYKDRGITEALVERAQTAGYRALCLTVDVPVQGHRERDIRSQFHLPPGIRVANLDHPLDETADDSALNRYIKELWDTTITWDVITWLRSLSDLPIVVKGIVSPEDALLALEYGASAVVVSNHGGRQLDGCISTCRALSPIVDAVEGRLEVFVDGGIRRGTDVVKALAMGARAVLIGRPYLYGLAVGGSAGVRHVFELLEEEIERAMGLLGCTCIDAIDRSFLAGGKRGS
jgi:4-hydroxymandelate oxidase